MISLFCLSGFCNAFLEFVEHEVELHFSGCSQKGTHILIRIDDIARRHSWSECDHRFFQAGETAEGRYFRARESRALEAVFVFHGFLLFAGRLTSWAFLEEIPGAARSGVCRTVDGGRKVRRAAYHNCGRHR